MAGTWLKVCNGTDDASAKQLGRMRIGESRRVVRSIAILGLVGVVAVETGV